MRRAVLSLAVVLILAACTEKPAKHATSAPVQSAGHLTCFSTHLPDAQPASCAETCAVSGAVCTGVSPAITSVYTCDFRDTGASTTCRCCALQ